jgi:putative ABC transport system permease protein
LRGLLVVSEVALALVLLTSAGLLTRSLSRLLSVNPGFETRNLMTARLSVPASRYDTPEKLEAFFRQWQARIESLPGVTGVAMVDRMPMMGFGNTGTPTVIGRPAADTGGTDTQLRTVNLDYFRVMGIPLRAGRGFSETDRSGAPRVVVVNQAFALSTFPGEDPLGRKLSFVFMNGQPPLEIVGVVADENVGNIDARARASRTPEMRP